MDSVSFYFTIQHHLVVSLLPSAGGEHINQPQSLALPLKHVVECGCLWGFSAWVPSVLPLICPILSGSMPAGRAGRRTGRGRHGRLAAGHRFGAL